MSPPAARQELLPGSRAGLPLAAGKFAAETWHRVRVLTAQDRAFYLVVSAHALAAVVALFATGQGNSLAFSSYFLVWPLVFLLQFPVIYGLVGIFQVVHRFDARRRLAFRALFSPRRLAALCSGFLLLIGLMVFQGAFTSFKNVFPVWAGGFAYDHALAGIDRALYLGHDPWTLLYRVGDSSLVRSIVEWSYDKAWFIVCYGILFWIAVAPEAARVRTRYMVTYVTIWLVLGNLLAGLLPSAGPAFYGDVTGDTARFAPQLAFLASGPERLFSASVVQQYLWSLYSAGLPGFGSGISAFPSVHVGLVTMNAIFVWEYRRWLGVIAFAYVGFIAASSVYLAWHYSVDGIAAIFLTVVITLTLKKLMRPASPGFKAS